MWHHRSGPEISRQFICGRLSGRLSVGLYAVSREAKLRPRWSDMHVIRRSDPKQELHSHTTK